MIKIIVDSTCDLPENIMEKHDIKILPLRVYLDDKEFLDKATITVEEVYDAMKKGIYPKTSQPNPAYIYDLFEGYAAKQESFIYFSFSSKLSGTYQTTSLIVDELREKYPKVNMAVIDSKGGSAGTGLIALQAAKLAEAGENFQTILKVSKEQCEHIEHIFTLTDLDWVVKGGRLSKTSAVIGNFLDIKPIIHVIDGEMEIIKKIRGKKKALKTVVDIVEQRIKDFPDQLIGISHADDIETALKIKDMIIERLGEKQIMINKIGSVLGTHLGIGGVGVLFFNKKSSTYIE